MTTKRIREKKKTSNFDGTIKFFFSFKTKHPFGERIIEGERNYFNDALEKQINYGLEKYAKM